jgi:hypothetical protein
VKGIVCVWYNFIFNYCQIDVFFINDSNAASLAVSAWTVDIFICAWRSLIENGIVCFCEEKNVNFVLKNEVCHL